MMMKYRALFYKLGLLFLAVVIASCSRQGNLKFCEKPENEEDKPTVCGNKFSIGELVLFMENSSETGTDTLVCKFYTDESSKSNPVDVIKLKTDPSSKVIKNSIELYNAGVYQVVLEKPDGTSLGSGELSIIDVE